MRPLRIGIDAYSVKDRAGIGRYSRELIRELTEEAGGDEIVLFHPRGQPWSEAGGRGARRVTSRFSSRAAWELFALPGLLRPALVDVFHGPDFTLPRGVQRGVVTIHDVTFLDRPEFVSRRARLLYGVLAPGAARRARLVICPSEHACSRISQRLGVSPERIRVIGEGVSPAFGPADGPLAARARLSLPEGIRARRYVLGVGTIQRRKNFTALARAVARLRTEAPDLALVIAGADGVGGRRIHGEMAAILGAGNVWTGTPDDRALADLYRAAIAACVVSHAEGFGLPILEAFACGTRVVTLACEPLVEVAGGAATLAESPEPEAIAEAIRCVLAESAPERAARVHAGLERASAMSWKRAARRTLEAYREAAEGASCRPAR